MKLHLGCWHRYIPGFIHVDLCDMPHIDYKRSIDDLSIFCDCSAELIYCSHCFEYFDRFQAVNVLREWHRVLKPGGILRIAVPDFDKLIEVYLKSGDINKILGPIFGRMEIQTPESIEVIYHKTVYNYDCLNEILGENGFEDVKAYDWRETIHKDYDDHSQSYYPHMDKEKGILLSLNVEAKRI
jgi:predicted SAM-dependent methyltransferase